MGALALLLTGGSCLRNDDGEEAGEVDSAGAVEARDLADGAFEPTVPDRPDRETRIERPVFDLGDNRLLAHTYHGDALFIDAGSPGFGKYVRFAMPKPYWTLGRQVDGQPVALAGKKALLEVPLGPAQIAGAELAMRVHSTKERRLSLRVNGRKGSRKDSRVELEVGWQTIRMPLPEDRLVVGENLFAFDIKRSKPIAVAWVRIGPAGAELGEGTQRPAPLSGYDDEAKGFVLRQGSELAFYAHVPESGHLVADVAGAGSGDEPCSVAVSAQSRDASDPAAEADDMASTLAGAGARVDLGQLANRPARMAFRVEGCAEATLSGARFTIPGAPATSHSGPAPEHVILWIMDTMRADRLRPFEPGARPQVPHLERLAAAGTVFKHHWVQGNESQGSHSSIWTSLYPLVHGVRTAGDNQNYVLSNRFPKIAGLMKEQGFTTIGVTGNKYVSRGGRYSTGFDIWRNLMREGKARRGHLPGEKIYGLGIELMAEHVQKSGVYWFLGTYDTHKPWVAHKPWIDIYDPKPYRGRFEKGAWPGDIGMVRGRMACNTKQKPRDLERINAIYDSDISYQDQLVGRLMDQLEEWGVLDKTMIIISADHGEELWEDGRCGHGFTLLETLVRVPLLIHYPPLFPGGRVVTEGVESVDILPTILAAMGQEMPAMVQGQSLVALAQGVQGGYPEPSYASQYEYAHAMRLGDWKLWVKRSNTPRLYNFAVDPTEKKTFHAEYPIARRYLTDVFSLFMAYRHVWKKHRMGPPSNMTARAARDLERIGKSAKKPLGSDS